MRAGFATLSVLIGTILCAVGAGGCAGVGGVGGGKGGLWGKLNQGPAITDGFAIEAISPDQVKRPFPSLRPGESDKRSLVATSLSRGNWALRRIAIPAGSVENRPTYATGPSYTSSTNRQRGEFPTFESVLDLGDSESAWSEIYEGLAWPFWAGLDIALMPARMIMLPPHEVVHSPDVRRDRAPAGTPTPRGLGDPETEPFPGLDTRPTVPPLATPRWIWRDGKWYRWKPGDPEPWLAPKPVLTPQGEQPADVPALPSQPGESPDAAPEPPAPKPAAPSRDPNQPRWVFRNGKWVKEPGSGAPKP